MRDELALRGARCGVLAAGALAAGRSLRGALAHRRRHLRDRLGVPLHSSQTAAVRAQFACGKRAAEQGWGRGDSGTPCTSWSASPSDRSWTRQQDLGGSPRTPAPQGPTHVSTGSPRLQGGWAWSGLSGTEQRYGRLPEQALRWDEGGGAWAGRERAAVHKLLARQQPVGDELLRPDGHSSVAHGVDAVLSGLWLSRRDERRASI